MNQNLEQLIALSQKFGKNLDYIIAGGGNSSYKDEEKMWVKASGTSMGVIDENGFVCLNRNKMQVLSERAYSTDSTLREQEVKQDLQNAILFPEGKRPSVEASMHEIIRYPFVLHTHPTLANGVLCAKNSKETIQKHFGDAVIYIEYTDPGYILFKKVNQALELFRAEHKKEAQIIFLENHGVFVGAQSCEEIELIYAEIEDKFTQGISDLPSSEDKSDSTELEKIASEIKVSAISDGGLKVCDNSELTKCFVENFVQYEGVSIPFTPDAIVYCKSKYLYLTNTDNVNAEIEGFTVKNGYYPKVVMVEGEGLICVEESLNSANIVKDVYKDMMKVSMLTNAYGGPRPMSQSQIDFIDNWEVENYRRKISKES